MAYLKLEFLSQSSLYDKRGPCDITKLRWDEKYWFGNYAK